MGKDLKRYKKKYHELDDKMKAENRRRYRDEDFGPFTNTAIKAYKALTGGK